MNFFGRKKDKSLLKCKSSSSPVNSSSSSVDSGNGSSSSVDATTSTANVMQPNIECKSSVISNNLEITKASLVVNDNNTSDTVIPPTTPTSLNSNSSSEVDYGPQGTIKRKQSMSRMNPRLPLKSTTTRILVQQSEDSRIEVTENEESSCKSCSKSIPCEVNGSTCSESNNDSSDMPFNRNNRFQYGTLRSRMKNNVNATQTSNGSQCQAILMSLTSPSSSESIEVMERMSVVSHASSLESGFVGCDSASPRNSTVSALTAHRLSSQCSNPVSFALGPTSDISSLASSSQFVMEDDFDDDEDVNDVTSQGNDKMTMQSNVLRTEDMMMMDQLPLPPPPPELLESSSLSSSLSTLSLNSLPPPPEFACETLKRIQELTSDIKSVTLTPNTAVTVRESPDSSSFSASVTASPASSPGSSPSDHSYNNDADAEATLARDPYNHHKVSKLLKKKPGVNQFSHQDRHAHQQPSLTQMNHSNSSDASFSQHDHQDKMLSVVVGGEVKTNCPTSFASFQSPVHHQMLKQPSCESEGNSGKLEPGHKCLPMYSSPSSCCSDSTDDAAQITQVQVLSKQGSRAEDLMLQRQEGDETHHQLVINAVKNMPGNKKAQMMKKKIMMSGIPGQQERIYDSVFTYRKNMGSEQLNAPQNHSENNVSMTSASQQPSLVNDATFRVGLPVNDVITQEEAAYASFHRPSREELRSPMKGPLVPPPQDFMRNLQRVMEKKWKVAQSLHADLSSFSSQRAQHRKPPPPPTRSERTRLSGLHDSYFHCSHSAV